MYLSTPFIRKLFISVFIYFYLHYPLYVFSVLMLLSLNVLPRVDVLLFQNNSSFVLFLN